MSDTASDPALPLQIAVFETLSRDESIKTLVGAKNVLDGVKPGQAKPYISFGPHNSRPENAQEYEGDDAYLQVDGWSTGPRRTEIKQIGAAIRKALHGANLSVQGFRVVTCVVDSTRYLTEPDGVTQHVAIIIRVRTEPSA